MLLWIALTVCSLVVLLAAIKLELQWLRAISKTLASTGFLGVAVSTGAAETVYGQLSLAALVLCWMGDVLLLGRSKGMFMAGLGVFLLGHVAFGVAFVGLGQDWLWAGAASIGMAGLAVVVGRWLLPHVSGRMRAPVIAYIAVISGMAALAAGAVGGGGTPWVMVGAVAFFVSDLGVARNRFVAPAFINRALGLPLYYAATTILAATAGGVL